MGMHRTVILLMCGWLLAAGGAAAFPSNPEPSPVRPPERALRFKNATKTVESRQAMHEHPGFEAVVRFEEDVYNKWGLIDKLMRQYPVSEADRQRYKTIFPWDRRVNLRQEGQMTIYAAGREEAQQTAALCIRLLDAQIAEQIHADRQRLQTLRRRQAIFKEFLDELQESGADALRRPDFENLAGLSAPDAEALKFGLQKDLLQAQVDAAALEEKLSRIRCNQPRSDEPQASYRQILLQAEADLEAARRRATMLESKIKILTRYAEQKRSADTCQADRQTLEPFLARFVSEIDRLRSRLGPDGVLKFPRVVDNTVTIYEVEVTD